MVDVTEDDRALLRLMSAAENNALAEDEVLQLIADHRAAQSAELEALRGEAEETAEIAEQDGYSKAVQDIDVRTGGDGEYYASTIPGRGCETPQAMMANIVERFSEKEATITQLRARAAALEEGLKPFARAAKWWKAFHDFQRIISLHQDGDCLEVAHLRNAAALLNQNGEVKDVT